MARIDSRAVLRHFASNAVVTLLGAAGLGTTMYSEGREQRKRTTPQGEL